MVGVNGTGKTTTIGKLAARYVAADRSIILAAADTFRAAAIDQLRIWADRAGVPFRFMTFLFLAFPMMLMSIIVSTIYVYLRYLS